MLMGLGIDVVAVSALAEQLADRASSFAAATFTDDELGYSQGAPSGEPARHLAARYAAKEAAIKAFDTACGSAGVPRQNVSLKEIEVRRDEVGRPWLVFTGAVRHLAEQLGADRAWVSLSHDGDYATAVVALERLP